MMALPEMEKGIAWLWTIRNREIPDQVMGLICLYDEEDNNRGFWLAPEYQGQGFMREASIAATDYWFNVLNRPLLRSPKAAVNSRSQRISVISGTRLIKTLKTEYVSGLLDSEIWEITRAEWNAQRVMILVIKRPFLAHSRPAGASGGPIRARSGRLLSRLIRLLTTLSNRTH